MELEMYSWRELEPNSKSGLLKGITHQMSSYIIKGLYTLHLIQLYHNTNSFFVYTLRQYSLSLECCYKIALNGYSHLFHQFKSMCRRFI